MAAFATTTGEEDALSADPVVIHNTETDGYLANVNQSVGGGPPGWVTDRGLVCVELIRNWVAEVMI